MSVRLICTLAVALLFVSISHTQNTTNVTCYCNVEQDYCVDNTCVLGIETNRMGCVVDYFTTDQTLRYFCREVTSSCASSPEGPVLKYCCATTDCNRCELPEHLTYDQCLTVTLPPGCDPLNCTKFSRHPPPDKSLQWIIPICVLVMVATVAGSVAVFVIVCVCQKRRKTQQVDRISHNDPCLSEYEGSTDEISSGCLYTGKGIMLNQRTIADEIVMEERIACGGFGEVWIARRHGDRCAVKIYKDNPDIQSYERECTIYTSGQLVHPNIALFWAADTKYNVYGSCELWIIMKYYPLGCLAEYLADNILEPMKSLKILRSIVSALDFLHNPFTTVHGRTHSIIAHRDIKSRNILVESEDGTCVLTDFGLSVTEKEFAPGAPPVKAAVGTKRYMAPELLSDTVNMNIQSFCQTDVYSFGLIMWEVLRRVNINGHARDYMCPYQNHLPSNPTLEDMRKVVVEQRVRPELDWLTNNEVVWQSVKSLMKECWSGEPEGRPSATRLRIKLDPEHLNPYLKMIN